MPESMLSRADVLKALKEARKEIRKQDGKGNTDSQRLIRAGVSELEHFLEVQFQAKENECLKSKT